MIQVHSWPTPNGHKVHVMLEECGLRLGRDWQVHAVNIGQGDQFQPEFLKISPNNKIPAIVDTDGPAGTPISVFESGAILQYLADRTGRFLPADQLRTALDGVGALGATRVLCYCGGGIAASVTFFALRLLGRSQVALYDNSLLEWSADPARPVARGAILTGADVELPPDGVLLALRREQDAHFASDMVDV